MALNSKVHPQLNGEFNLANKLSVKVVAVCELMEHTLCVLYGALVDNEERCIYLRYLLLWQLNRLVCI